ncbi:putative ArsR family transcriptional regulator [Streptomyces luteogriseus]|nr:putative ArsR family transcriptional regulator [Streptomyces luteogriseus]
MHSTHRAETFPNTPAASQVFTTVLSHGPLTRLEAARRAGLSPAAVTKAVRPLIEAGHLTEEADAQARPTLGRPANPLRVNGDRALFVGAKVTGDEIIGVLPDLCCQVGSGHAPDIDRIDVPKAP